MSLKSSYYKTTLLGIKRGNYRGAFSNAKPLFVIALIEAITEGAIWGNKIIYISDRLKSIYTSTSKTLEPERTVTPIHMPFFHLLTEPFYHIKWITGIKPPMAAHTPSAKFLRENVEYACLDDELWELLQDPETRNELRDAIIQHFIKPRT